MRLLQHLIQGEGIIDIVNTYLQIALEYGYVGLFLFLLIFLGIGIKIQSLIRESRISNNYDLERLGISILVSFVSILVIIGTVSSLNSATVKVFYWSFAGLGTAYIRLYNNTLNSISSALNK